MHFVLTEIELSLSLSLSFTNVLPTAADRLQIMLKLHPLRFVVDLSYNKLYKESTQKSKVIQQINDILARHVKRRLVRLVAQQVHNKSK